MELVKGKCKARMPQKGYKGEAKRSKVDFRCYSRDHSHLVSIPTRVSHKSVCVNSFGNGQSANRYLH